MLNKKELEEKTLLLIKENDFLKRVSSVLLPLCDVFLVGGALRDLAQEKEIKDIDLCVSKDIKTVCNALKKERFSVVETGLRHGTISVFENNIGIEITEFRGEPENLISDLSLRDFTINTISFDMKKNEIIDPFSGIKDLKDNVLKSPIDAQKVFNDDPLRILRMFRFSYAQNRIPDESLILASKEIFPKIKDVSIERIKDELSSILISENPSLAILKLQEFGFLETLFPELMPMVNCKQNKYHKNDVFFHTLDVISRTPPILEVRLSALLHDTGKPHTITTDENGERHFYGHEKESTRIAKEFLTRLCFSKKMQNTVSNLVSLHMRNLDSGASGIRRLMRDIKDDFDFWVLLIKADKPPMMDDETFNMRLNNFLSNYEKEKEAQQLKDFLRLAISGEDIMKILHLSPSSKVGKIKKELEEYILNFPDKNTKEDLEKYLRKKFLC